MFLLFLILTSFIYTHPYSGGHLGSLDELGTPYSGMGGHHHGYSPFSGRGRRRRHESPEAAAGAAAGAAAAGNAGELAHMAYEGGHRGRAAAGALAGMEAGGGAGGAASGAAAGAAGGSMHGSAGHGMNNAVAAGAAAGAAEGAMRRGASPVGAALVAGEAEDAAGGYGMGGAGGLGMGGAGGYGMGGAGGYGGGGAGGYGGGGAGGYGGGGAGGYGMGRRFPTQEEAARINEAAAAAHEGEAGAFRKAAAQNRGMAEGNLGGQSPEGGRGYGREAAANQAAAAEHEGAAGAHRRAAAANQRRANEMEAAEYERNAEAAAGEGDQAGAANLLAAARLAKGGHHGAASNAAGMGGFGAGNAARANDMLGRAVAQQEMMNEMGGGGAAEALGGGSMGAGGIGAGGLSSGGLGNAGLGAMGALGAHNPHMAADIAHAAAAKHNPAIAAGLGGVAGAASARNANLAAGLSKAAALHDAEVAKELDRAAENHDSSIGNAAQGAMSRAKAREILVSAPNGDVDRPINEMPDLKGMTYRQAAEEELENAERAEAHARNGDLAKMEEAAAAMGREAPRAGEAGLKAALEAKANGATDVEAAAAARAAAERENRRAGAKYNPQEEEDAERALEAAKQARSAARGAGASDAETAVAGERAAARVAAEARARDAARAARDAAEDAARTKEALEMAEAAEKGAAEGQAAALAKRAAEHEQAALDAGATKEQAEAIGARVAAESDVPVANEPPIVPFIEPPVVPVLVPDSIYIPDDEANALEEAAREAGLQEATRASQEMVDRDEIARRAANAADKKMNELLAEKERQRAADIAAQINMADEGVSITPRPLIPPRPEEWDKEIESGIAADLTGNDIPPPLLDKNTELGIIGTVPDDTSSVDIRNGKMDFPLKTFNDPPANNEVEGAAKRKRNQLKDDLRNKITKKKFDSPLNVIEGEDGNLNIPESAEKVDIDDGRVYFDESAKPDMEKDNIDTSRLVHMINTGERKDIPIGRGYYVADASGTEMEVPSPRNPDPVHMLVDKNGNKLDISRATGLDIAKGSLKMEPWSKYSKRLRPTVNTPVRLQRSSDPEVNELRKKITQLDNTTAEVITNPSGRSYVKLVPPYGVAEQVPLSDALVNITHVPEKVVKEAGQEGVGIIQGTDTLPLEEKEEENKKSISLNITEGKPVKESYEEVISMKGLEESVTDPTTSEIINVRNAFNHLPVESKEVIIASASRPLNDEDVDTIKNKQLVSQRVVSVGDTVIDGLKHKKQDLSKSFNISPEEFESKVNSFDKNIVDTFIKTHNTPESYKNYLALKEEIVRVFGDKSSYMESMVLYLMGNTLGQSIKVPTPTKKRVTVTESKYVMQPRQVNTTVYTPVKVAEKKTVQMHPGGKQIKGIASKGSVITKVVKEGPKGGVTNQSVSYTSYTAPKVGVHGNTHPHHVKVEEKGTVITPKVTKGNTVPVNTPTSSTTSNVRTYYYPTGTGYPRTVTRIVTPYNVSTPSVKGNYKLPSKIRKVINGVPNRVISKKK